LRWFATYGRGARAPNPDLLGDTSEDAHNRRFARMMGFSHRSRRNVIIVRDPYGRGCGDRKRIDVGWGGLKGNGGLMTILAYLLKSSFQWSGVEVRLKMVVPTEDAARDATANIREIVDQMRTGATPEVLVAGKRSFGEILRDSSGDADLILLGLAEPGDDFAGYLAGVRERCRGLPTQVHVLAAEEIGYGDVLK
jgi:hypothetical protein